MTQYMDAFGDDIEVRADLGPAKGPSFVALGPWLLNPDQAVRVATGLLARASEVVQHYESNES